jgi:hypothetical protein
MRLRRTSALLAIGGASATLLAMTATPASAATAVGIAEGFFRGCDASVYVSDDLIGSAGKVEAWGGFVCAPGRTFVGQMRITLKKGNTKAKEHAKNVNGSTDHVEVTVANSAGKQDWHADLWLFRPGFPATIVSTGVVRS